MSMVDFKSYPYPQYEERRKVEITDLWDQEMPKGYELILDCTIKHKDGFTTDYYVVVKPGVHGAMVVCPSTDEDGLYMWLLGFKRGIYQNLDDQHTHSVMMDFLDPAMRS